LPKSVGFEELLNRIGIGHVFSPEFDGCFASNSQKPIPDREPRHNKRQSEHNGLHLLVIESMSKFINMMVSSGDIEMIKL